MTLIGLTLTTTSRIIKSLISHFALDVQHDVLLVNGINRLLHHFLKRGLFVFDNAESY